MKAIFLGVCTFLLIILPVIGAGGGDGVPDSEISSVEERRLRISLQQEVERLRQREEKVRLREMELKTLEEQDDKKLAELKRLREEVAVVVARRDEEQNRRIRDLSQMYEKMEPSRAAMIMMDVEEDLAVGIFTAMKKKSAGRILENMPQEKATRLTEAYPILGLH